MTKRPLSKAAMTAGIVHLSALPTRCIGILLARLNATHFADAKPQNPQGSTFAYGARSVEICSRV